MEHKDEGHVDQDRLDKDCLGKEHLDQDRLDHEYLDQWLEAALHQYGSAEPRLGLENRILAGLAAEDSRFTARQRWSWAFMAATAAGAVVVALWVGDALHGHGRGR